MSILRLHQVEKKTGLSKSGIYELMKAGGFPKQVKISARSVGWLEVEINQWLADRIAERDKEVA